MSAILGLFDLFSLLYLLRGFQLLITLWRRRRAVLSDPLARWKKQLAQQASFFVAVPPGVLVHELGHALAVWLFGGQVVEFKYRVFWGSVLPQGAFTAGEQWFISLAGTLGSLLFGAALWAAFSRHTSQSMRYFGLRAFRFQLFFALVYYPVFTFVLPIGDWLTIYNFTATPILSGITAVFHLSFLLLFWRADRAGWFEMPGQEDLEAQARFRQLQGATATNPHDHLLYLRYIDAVRQGGARNQARRLLQQYLRLHPESAPARLSLAANLLEGKNYVPAEAGRHVEKALALGLDQPHQLAYAEEVLGRWHLERDQSEKAVEAFSRAIDASQKLLNGSEGMQDRQRGLAQLYHWRSQAHRRRRHYDLAYGDTNRAITLAQAAADPDAARIYEGELEIIADQASRSPIGHM